MQLKTSSSSSADATAPRLDRQGDNDWREIKAVKVLTINYDK